jgi:hypothetical protein
MRKAALICGIAGGFWGLLAPVLVLIPIASQAVSGGVGQETRVSMLEAGVAGSALPVLSFISMMGLLGLLAILLLRRRPGLGRPFLWVSAGAMLAISALSIFSIGLFFLPAVVLLLVGAIWLKGSTIS